MIYIIYIQTKSKQYIYIYCFVITNADSKKVL